MTSAPVHEESLKGRLQKVTLSEMSEYLKTFVCTISTFCKVRLVTRNNDKSKVVKQ